LDFILMAMKIKKDSAEISYLGTTLLIVFILFNLGLAGQEANQEDFDVANKPFANRTYIDSLNKSAFSIFRTDPAETRKIALKSLALSQQISYPTGQGKANNYIAMTYHISGNFDSSYVFYQKALDIFKTHNDTLNIGKVYNNLALLFTNREYYNLALQYNLKSLEFAELMNDMRGKFHSYNNIGITYEQLGEYQKAIDSYNNSLKTIEQETNTGELYYYAVSNIGIINLKTQQYDSAEIQLNRGLEYYLGQKDNYGISQSYRYLGELYIETGNYIQAEVSLKKSNRYAAKIENKKIFLENQFLMARLHFAKKEFPKARNIFTKTITEARSANSIDTEIESLNYISKIDSIEGYYFEALKSFQASIVLKDSLNSLKIQNQIAEFSIQYLTLQKDQEIARLTQSDEMKELEINKHLTQRNLIFVIMLAIITILIYGLYTSGKIRRKNQLLTLQNDEIDKKNLELLTHRNQLEELVDQRTIELVKSRDKAQESDRLKSAFLANMSHEIRTPMNGILGFADLLKEPGIKGDMQKKYIGVIEKSGLRMLNIISEIIDISKIESGTMNVRLSDLNINAQMDYVYAFFKPEAEEKQIEFKVTKVLQDKKAIIKTDQDKLKCILTNLIKNAIKYTESGSIEFGYSLSESKTELEFYVKDTGIGIPKNRQSAIFERFIQADIEDKMARQGAGLGLAITRAYIEMLEGKIWVESQENVGTTFYFTLAYSKEKSSEMENPGSIRGKPEQIKNLKILIVEDDVASSQLLAILVNDFGKEIINVKTGEEAINACLNNPDIDLVLMDIQMPGMNGYEATKQIRGFNKEVIIIAQTAFALAGDKEKSIESGCNDYISKPIKKTELESLIQKYIKQ
jgi:signal transduction histidine kinase